MTTIREQKQKAENALKVAEEARRLVVRRYSHLNQDSFIPAFVSLHDSFKAAVRAFDCARYQDVLSSAKCCMEQIQNIVISGCYPSKEESVLLEQGILTDRLNANYNAFIQQVLENLRSS